MLKEGFSVEDRDLSSNLLKTIIFCFLLVYFLGLVPFSCSLIDIIFFSPWMILVLGPLVCYDQPFSLWRVHLIYTIWHFDNIYVKYIYITSFFMVFFFLEERYILYHMHRQQPFYYGGAKYSIKEETHTHIYIYIYISNIYIFCRGFICHWQYVHGQDKASIMRDFFF